MQSAIKRVESTSNIELCHVPGHRGVLGNEVADFIASRAATRGLAQKSKWSSQTVRAKFNTELRKRWASEWSSENSDTELYKGVLDWHNCRRIFHQTRLQHINDLIPDISR
ncbi:hypothetical protein MRX96_057014 [Rhipicephalus microplus]